MDWPLWKDIGLFALALYGAILSTFNLRQALRKDRRSMRVVMGTAMTTYTDGTLGHPFAKLEATNIGHRAITITSLHLEVPGGGRLVVTSNDAFPAERDTRLPVELSDGAAAKLYVPYGDIASALHHSGRTGKVTLTPVAEDTTGGVHRGKPWSTSAAELMRAGQA